MEALKPKLRFKDYFDDWESKTLKDVCMKPKYGLNSSATQYDGINGYIRITDIDDQSRRFLRNKITSPDEYSDDYLLEKNDLLFTRTGASTGKTYLYNENDGKLYFAGFLIKFNINKANSNFIFYTTLLSKYDKWVQVMSMRSGQPGINADEYSSLSLLIPSFSEQTKIANFLSSVDEKINLLKEKKALLEEYKKGIMQKIFNQKIRFKDDKGNDFVDWNEKCLGDIGDIITGKTPSTKDSDLWSGEIQFITPTDIKEGVKYQTKTERYVTKNDKLKILPENSIVYTCIASIGKMCISKFPCITNQQINSLVINKIHDFEYVYYWLLYLTPHIKSTQSNTTLPIINKTDFSKFIIKLPSIKEQTKIANFLSAIDKKIELVSTQIEDTQEYKKGLLQQMFV